MPPERIAPPYRAQWESPGLVGAFLAGRDAATDPLWPASGAADAAEYARWADHLCGMACLQMALAARGHDLPIHSLRRAVQAHGGYLETPQVIRGLIYAGAVAWLHGQGATTLDVVADTLPGEGMFIASVHPAIRRPGQPPPGTGGHLVLVFGRDAQGRLRFHNPSGDSAATQRDVRLSPAAFSGFFAGRGIRLRW